MCADKNSTPGCPKDYSKPYKRSCNSDSKPCYSSTAAVMRPLCNVTIVAASLNVAPATLD